MSNITDAEKRMREFLKTRPFFTKEQLEALAQAEEDATCKKCGRVIYCGVNTLCKEPNCGLKNGS